MVHATNFQMFQKKSMYVHICTCKRRYVCVYVCIHICVCIYIERKRLKVNKKNAKIGESE